jgi:hypothetical protein
MDYGKGFKDIKKHKNDVFRLAATLPGNRDLELPDTIKEDLGKFVDLMEENPPEVIAILKQMGITAFDVDDLIKQLKLTFRL